MDGFKKMEVAGNGVFGAFSGSSPALDCCWSLHGSSFELETFKLQVEADEVESESLPERIRCHFTLRALNDEPDSDDEDDDAIFGFPIVAGLTSPTCEYLSFDAWKQGVEKSPYDLRLMSFLPLFICPEHYEKSRRLIHAAIECEARAWKNNSMKHRTSADEMKVDLDKVQLSPTSFVLYFSTVLCSLQVESIKAANDAENNHIRLSDRMVEGFFQVVRLGLKVLEESGRVQQAVEKEVSLFLKVDLTTQHETKRSQLGRVLVLLHMSSYTWKDIQQAYLQESMSRDVVFMVKKYPQLDDLTLPKKDRKQLTFEATKASRLFIAFNVLLLRLCPSQRELTQLLDSRYGLISPEVLGSIANGINEIERLATWEEYFAFLQMPKTEDEVYHILIEAVKRSRNSLYHGSPDSLDVIELLRLDEDVRFSEQARQAKLDAIPDWRSGEHRRIGVGRRFSCQPSCRSDQVTDWRQNHDRMKTTSLHPPRYYERSNVWNTDRQLRSSSDLDWRR